MFFFQFSKFNLVNYCCREEVGRLPPNVDVQIGDKLKVYYGDRPIQDAKVTYEAKV